MTAKKVVQGLIVTMALCLSTTTGRAQDNRFFIMGGGSSLLDQRSFTQCYQLALRLGVCGRRQGDRGSRRTAGKSKIFGVEGSFGFGRNNLEISNPNISPETSKRIRREE